MSDAKVQVPGAAKEAILKGIDYNNASSKEIEYQRLYGVLLFCSWLAENPIVPNENQVYDLTYGMRGIEPFASIAVKHGAVEWQRRMFVAPGPEVPEEIKPVFRFDAILERPATAKDEPVSEREKRQGVREHVLCVRAEDYDQLLEAFRRSQQSKEK